MAVDTSPPPRPPPTAGRGGRHRVVVIGSGFGGLWTTEALAKAPVAVTVISMTSHHLFQPLLYQVATGVLSEGEVAPATREVLKKQPNATVLLGRVTEIDLDARTVTSLSPLGTTVTPYDSLVVAAGAGQSYFGNDQFSEFAPGMKSIDDALELRGRIFGSFELAELCTDPAETEEWLTFIVVGAGPTGVEMAGPDRRAGAPYAAPRLPPDRHQQGPGDPARRRPGRARARSARSCPPRRASSWPRSASRCSSTSRWSASTTPGST